MAKRQAEDDLDRVDDPAAKRSRVDIADLLGSDGDVGNSSSATGAVQQDTGHIEQRPHQNTASVNSNEAGVHPHAEAGPSSNVNTSQTALAQAPVKTLATTSNGRSQEGTVVYIAFKKHGQDFLTDSDLLGLFSDVAKANEAVMKEFVNHYDDSVFDPSRQYSADGELYCRYQEDPYGEHPVEFWVERHVVDDPSKSITDVQKMAAELEFVGIFADYDYGSEDGDEDEPEE